ncbi:MAG TPA: flagellar export protein FliJ [Burkholderiales bacterium]|nr:flagellar export protein FliJ [Burkholderiales bacterium]
MPQQQSLNFLIDHAEMMVQNAAKTMQGEKILFEEAKSKLLMLVEYHADYRSRLTSPDSKALSANAWRDFYLFLNKLEEAIELQNSLVSKYQKSYEEAVSEWNHVRQRHKAFLALQKRQHAAVRQKIGKREQKETDEYAARRKQ